ncbi:ABC transporter permease [Sporosarcina limicola]|uniref:ABC-2 type transport system permease protein n=1 Tax=Sporosarcina limicola TaxID=34101 RepID=A0A927MH39_9BACL|nr:ABC transporter permease [Sporosarcina limicola]MBE1553042.1 ABC-2 type transport system permease protein [Sporosarcina limicola]
MLTTQLKYDLLMFSRELFYLIFILVVPPATYIFMGQLYGDFTYAGNLTYAQTYTPSFILLITFGVVFFSFGFEQVMHRTTGVEKRISLSPVPKKVLLLSSILKSIILTSFGFFIVYLIGIIVYNLSFNLLSLISSYGFFILLNALLLTISSAIYSFFSNMNSALVFSIIIFQVVMITGGFAIPVEMMPKFVTVIAEVNPIYHMNKLFIAIWNEQFQLDKSTFISIGYIVALIIIALVIIRFSTKRRN